MSRVLLVLSTPAVLSAITACYMGLLFIVAIEPDTGSPDDLMSSIHPTVANLLHVPAYGILGWLWILSLRGRGLVKSRVVGVTLAVCVLYGAALELVQTVVPGRFVSVWDVLANLAGVVIVCAWYAAGGRFMLKSYGKSRPSG